jgi:DNA-binding SARP family transcriptional activator/DNA-binding NarL/FixJ family response regulator
VSIEFRILGTLAVVRDGRDVPLRGPRTRALLAALLLEPNRTVSNDRLIDALWGEAAPGSSLSALRVNVSRLRKALGDEGRVVTEATGYRLTIDPDELDTLRFKALHDEASQHLADGDAVRAAETLRLALSLWRGPALADFVDDAFAVADATRLEEARLAAVEDRVEAELACGEHARLVGELESLTASHPLRERLWAARLIALYRCGRQADALRAYQSVRTLMIEELGIEPGPELRALEDAILRQDEEVLAAPTQGRPTSALRLMLVDDHPMWREAVRGFLERKNIAQVVAEADDGRVAVEIATDVRPDVIVMDLHLPGIDGAAATREILKHVPATKILVLSSSNEEPDVVDALKAGARGYLLKTGTAAEVADAVQRVARGEAVFSPSLAAMVLDELRQEHDRERPALSVRQREILRLFSQGTGYRSIADKLGVTEAAVRQEVAAALAVLHGEEPPELTHERDQGRGLCTILFVDVVRSTEAAARMGDHGWRELLGRYHGIVSDVATLHGGRALKTAGDGALATFTQPSAAIDAALAVCERVKELGIEVRSGVHMGECEVTVDDVHGLAVHIGARVAAKARGGEVLVSQTVRDIVLGTGGAALADRGIHTLRGVPGRWRLFAAARP